MGFHVPQTFRKLKGTACVRLAWSPGNQTNTQGGPSQSQSRAGSKSIPGSYHGEGQVGLRQPGHSCHLHKQPGASAYCNMHRQSQVGPDCLQGVAKGVRAGSRRRAQCSLSPQYTPLPVWHI